MSDCVRTGILTPEFPHFHRRKLLVRDTYTTSLIHVSTSMQDQRRLVVLPRTGGLSCRQS